MKSAVFTATCYCFLVFAYLTVGKLSLDKDGGYRSISVVISHHNLKDYDSNVTSLVQKILDLFSASSEALWRATNKTLFIKQVSLTLPENLYDKLLADFKRLHALDQNYVTSFEEADVRIDVPHPFYGNRPYTLQSRGCGHLGHFIHVTPGYLTNDKVSVEVKSKDMVRQWARYRFGVFEELGYKGDKLYPPFYTDGNNRNPKPTGCSNIPIVGDMFDASNNASCEGFDLEEIIKSSCKFAPSEDDTNEDVESSLMSFYHSANVSFFCDSAVHKHQVNAPSKHNFLCKLQSVHDVIASSEDHKSVSKTVANLPKIKTKLSKTIGQTQFALAVDISNRTLLNDRNDLTVAAIHIAFKIFRVAFDRGEVVAMTYAERAEIARAAIDSFLPSKDVGVSCIKCVVEKAIDLKKKKLILISDGFIEDNDMKTVENAIRSSKIHLYLVLYPVNTAVKKWKAVARKIYPISEQSSMDTLRQLQSALVSILNFVQSDAKPHFSCAQLMKKGSTVRKGEFRPPDFAKEVFFVLKGAKGSRPLKVSFDGRTLNPSVLDFGYVKAKAFLSNNMDYNFSADADDVDVFISYQTDKFKLSVWTNADSMKPREPLAVYLQISSGYMPVIGVDATAILTNIGNNKTSSTTDLADAGDSQPDLTTNDGIYSGSILTSLTTDQAYSVHVKVSFPKQSFITSNRTWDDSNCCGSHIFISNGSKGTNLEQFEANLFSTLITVKSNINIADFPPLRITNLEITNVDHSEIALKWSAPGATFQEGTVSEYQINMSFNRTDVLMSEGNWKLIQLTPLAPKSWQSFTIQTRETDVDKIMYITIRAKNPTGVFSDPSNVAEALIKKTERVTKTPKTPKYLNTILTDKPEVTESDVMSSSVTQKFVPMTTTKSPPLLRTSQITLIIVLSFALVVVITIVIGAICWCRIKRSKEVTDLAASSISNWGRESPTETTGGVDNAGFKGNSGGSSLKDFNSNPRASIHRNSATQTVDHDTPAAYPDPQYLYAEPIRKSDRQLPKRDQTPADRAQNDSRFHPNTREIVHNDDKYKYTSF